MILEYHYILFLILIITLHISKVNKEESFKYAVFLTFVFIGCRACVVGADTYNYTLGYLGYPFYKGEEIEPLYTMYVNLLKVIGEYKPFFIFVNTVCSLFPIYLLIRKYSDNKTLSILWFFIFDIYVSYFVALRQILGLAALIMAVIYVQEQRKRKWIIYVVLSTIAFGFHTSTLIPAILYCLCYFISVNSRTIVLAIILITGLLGVVLETFDLMRLFNIFLNLDSGLTSEKLNAYLVSDHLSENTSSGYIFKLRFVWLGLFVFSFMDDKKINHWFSKIFLISIILYNIFKDIDMISRMNLAFYLYSLIVITWCFGNRYRNITQRFRFAKLLPLFIFLWFIQSYVRSHINYDLDNVDRMNPYYFFWEDYSSHPSIKRF